MPLRCPRYGGSQNVRGDYCDLRRIGNKTGGKIDRSTERRSSYVEQQTNRRV